MRDERGVLRQRRWASDRLRQAARAVERDELNASALLAAVTRALMTGLTYDEIADLVNEADRASGATAGRDIDSGR